jgi:esterase FrsA
MAHYPTTNSAGKKSAYRKSQDMLLRASQYFDIPIERVEIPFTGRPGEGDRIIAHLRSPAGTSRLPVLIVSGGIDTFKEDMHTEQCPGSVKPPPVIVQMRPTEQGYDFTELSNC